MIINMTSYNRYDYLLPTIKSLFRSEFPNGSFLYITDDASTDPRVINYLKSITPPGNLEMDVLFRDKNVGVALNETEGAKHCFGITSSDHIILINNDCIFNPRWIYKLLEARTSLGKARVGALTAFNYQYHKKSEYSHKVTGWVNKKVRAKVSCGALGAMIHRNVLFAMDNISGGWDCRYVDKCKEMGYGIYTTDKSYVQHIGYEGLHSREDGRVDIATDFKSAGGIMNKNKTFVIGDSHSTIFKYFKHFEVRGRVSATAHNLIESSSSTNSGKIIQKFVTSLPKGASIIMSFGEIDCRHHLTKFEEGKKRSKAVGKTIERLVKKALEIRKKGFYVALWAPVAQMDENPPINPVPQEVRNRLTREFIHKLKSACLKVNIPVMSIFEDTVDINDKTIPGYFRDSRHIKYPATRKFILRELNRVFTTIKERTGQEVAVLRKDKMKRKLGKVKYSIVIMSVNRAPKKNYIEPMINSLEKTGAFKRSDISITISDSGSEDLSYIDFVEDRNLPVKVLYSEKRLCLNENFSKAMIFGASETSEYVVFMEDDILVAPTLITEMDKFLKRYPKETIWSFHAMYAEVRKRAISGHDHWDMPKDKFYGTLCTVLRKDDARKLADYIYNVWYKKNGRKIGADIRIKIWLDKFYPGVDHIKCSAPSFVQHMGIESAVMRKDGGKIPRQNTSFNLATMTRDQMRRVKK